MQTILGSGGAIGVELSKLLPAYTDKIRLVSRDPKKVNLTDELFPCDIIQEHSLLKAVEGSDIVYLVIGLPYKTSIWQQQWPRLIDKTIDACSQSGAKLVFFDNMYMYDPNHIGNMNEQTPVKPTSKKGAVRAEIAQRIMTAVEKGRLEALIARAADFYGPSIANSVLLETVYKNIKNGKKANWFCSTAFLHSFTYTPDAGKATALLGNESAAYNQVWHVPTAPPMTGKQWIDNFAQQMNAPARVQLAGKAIVRLMGLFKPVMREFVEMLYQWDRDYVFDSSKFEKQFNLPPTPITQAIREICHAG